jgi:hypothetical protein
MRCSCWREKDGSGTARRQSMYGVDEGCLPFGRLCSLASMIPVNQRLIVLSKEDLM